MESTNSSGEEASFEEDVCDICFTPKSTLLISPCQHSACNVCFERLLLATSSPPNELQYTRQPADPSSMEEYLKDCIVAACPSRGRCPFCRTSVDLFQLRLKSNGERYYKNDTQIENTPLAGMVFKDTRKTSGDHSFHFPSSSKGNSNDDASDNAEKVDETDTEEEDTERMPFISFKKTEDMKLDNGNPLPRKKVFEEGFNYHTKSHTFRGTIDWTKDGSSFNGSNRWEVIIQFNSDFHHISRGAILKYNNKVEQNLTPFEGHWRVQYQKTRRRNERGQEEEESHSPPDVRIRVSGNSFHLYISYQIQIPSNGDAPYFVWTGHDNTRQTVESGVDLIRQKNGPDIGETIVWNVDHPDYHRILWTRESKCSAPSVKVERFGPKGTLQYKRCNRSSPSRHAVAASYKPDTIWGNTFVQGLAVGMASYHFKSENGEGENGVYISYEHSNCDQWPPLDNGLPVPSRVHFVDVSFNDDIRTFRGTIPWYGAYNTTWNGSAKWIYEMNFDSEYTCILSGTVKQYDSPEATRPNSVSNFGESLNYINAAFEEKLRTEFNFPTDNTSAGEEEDNNSIESPLSRESRLLISRSLNNRLEEEGVPMRTLHQLQTILRGTNSVDQNLNDD